MEIRLLGPLEVRQGVQVVPVSRRQQRALLATLALHAGEVVSTERLVADLWGDRAPASATGSLQNTVSALRKHLGRDVLVTQPPGYRLAVDREAVDANRFELLLAQSRAADTAARAAILRQALALWRGPALSDLEDDDFARREAARLDELRVTALEARVDAELELGRYAALVGELEQLVAQYPLREHLRGQLMVALYRCGRQAEALEVYRAARLALADELGLDPSPELQELERRVLRQDATLAAPPAREDSVPADEPSELRLVTVLAAAPPASAEPEQHRRLLDETLAAVRAALDRHGGTLERFGPEGLVAVFGADRPRDDDAARAVLVARELGLAAGVATGEALAGAGAVFTRAVELARGGGIRLDNRTRALLGRARRLDAPLVGRTVELAWLRSRLAEAGDAGRCRAVAVVGEPGIGKTRLARELALEAGADTKVVVARFVARGDGGPFAPLLPALREAAAGGALAAEADAEPVVARLGTLAEGDASFAESCWAVRRTLEALARQQAVLVVLDDVHWAEPGLLDLVDYLTDRADAALLLLCLARPELERPLGELLRLGPVDEDTARSIVAATADLDAETHERVVAAAEGNPLYAEQLATFAAEGGEGLPPTLEAVLAGRLGLLEPEERAVLQRAAVLGRDFPLAGVTALTGGSGFRELLALARAGFVHPAQASDPGDDWYSFHHVLLRDAAYAGLTKSDRADLHEHAAAWVDRDGRGDDALAGYHLEQATRWRRDLGESADELAARAGERLGEAGMRVWRTNDPGTASGLLARAVALLPEGARRAELLYELSLALRSQNRDAEADAALARAESDAGSAAAQDIAARVRAEHTLLDFFGSRLSLSEAIRDLEAPLAALHAEGDLRGLGRVELYAATIHASACDLAAWAAAAERAERHYRAAGFSPAVCIGIQAEALYYGATPVREALAQCGLLLGRATEKLSEATVSAVSGALHALTGAHAEASRLLGHARMLYEDIGSTRGTTMTLLPLAIDVARLAGDTDAAAELGREGVEAMLGIESPAYAATRAAQLADLLVDRGALQEADHYAALSERAALEADVYVQFLWRAVRARLLARAGALDEAGATAADAVVIASLTDALCDRARAHFALVEVHALAGDDAAAKREARVARALLRRKGAPALEVLFPTRAGGARVRSSRVAS
ncbi:MAG TPA: BTAD domain-containing putative transcriptional regulator [Gaiellaceae bacterium]|nr:BTAD domain-containing putative transcriptional regulator [Gaiellaceae bacterium]